MNFMKKSLLNKEVVGETKAIETELEVLEIPTEDYSICMEYERLVSKGDPLIKVPQKVQKKNRKEADKIKNSPDFDKLYDSYKKNKSKLEKKMELESSLKNTHTYIHHSILKILAFLQEHNYIESSVNIEDYENILPENVSIKGIIASQINECHELIFTEAIYNGYFDNLSPEELVGVLSIFLTTKVEGCDEKASIDSVDVSSNIKTSIHNIYHIRDSLSKDLISSRIYENADLELQIDMVEAVYEWAQGKDFNSIIGKYGLYSGNFVKDMVKLNNIVQDVVSMAKILDKIELQSLASQVENLIIRDNVNTESLYVKV